MSQSGEECYDVKQEHYYILSLFHYIRTLSRQTQTHQYCSTHTLWDMCSGAKWQLPDVSTDCLAGFRCDHLLESQYDVLCGLLYSIKQQRASQQPLFTEQTNSAFCLSFVSFCPSVWLAVSPPTAFLNESYCSWYGCSTVYGVGS